MPGRTTDACRRTTWCAPRPAGGAGAGLGLVSLGMDEPCAAAFAQIWTGHGVLAHNLVKISALAA